MSTPIPVALDDARAFTAIHWPAHNRAQGIAWDQQDHALALDDDDGTRLGVAIYKVIGGLAYLEQLVVAFGGTHWGTGSRLLRAFEEHVISLGAHAAHLETAETQAPGFYERHGYERLVTLERGRFGLDWHMYLKRFG